MEKYIYYDLVIDKYIDYDLIMKHLKGNHCPIKHLCNYRNILSETLEYILDDDNANKENIINLINYYTRDKAIEFYNYRHSTLNYNKYDYDEEFNGYVVLANTLIYHTFLHRYPTYDCIYV